MRERGNILFLILLAVVLFAALSYAVTSSMRGGGKDAMDEKLDVVVGQLLQNVNLIENTMMRAMMIDGIKEYGFDLSATGSNSTANATCQSNACGIFSGTGGSVPLYTMPDNTVDTVYPVRFMMAEVRNIGTSASDLVVVYRGLKRATCSAINKALKITDINLNVQIESYNWTPDHTLAQYSGTLTSLPSGYARFGEEQLSLSGKKGFCFNYNSGAESYMFVHVLMER